MKKILLAIVVLALAACTTQQQTNVTQAALKAKAQISNACTVVQPTLVDIQAGVGTQDAIAAATIQQIVAQNGKFCAAVTNLDATSAQSLINTTIPGIIQLVSTLPIDPVKKTTIQIALGAASIALSNFLVVYGQQPATPASGV